jgi:hypothetical protein
MEFESQINHQTVPQNISFYGIVSAQIFLIGIFIAAYCKHYYLCFIIILLYISTILYWRRTHLVSLLKTVDILLAIFAALFITFYYSPKYFKPTYINVWNNFIVFLIILFVINDYIFYSKCVIKENKESIFYLYPLVYATEHTKEREFEYYRNVFTHCIFIHVMPILVYFYCCYKSSLL